ncbi:hypothetical protein OL229_21370 [Neisseriaceae bacterium JH1-16]|nr:hypothetical protein [Neisseriaceae bacterium JH1-16]
MTSNANELALCALGALLSIGHAQAAPNDATAATKKKAATKGGVSALTIPMVASLQPRIATAVG